jgi:hypothetical protein
MNGARAGESLTHGLCGRRGAGFKQKAQRAGATAVSLAGTVAGSV